MTIKKNGFTLVEVIVVSIIVAALAAVAIPSYIGYIRAAKVDTAKSTCELIAAAVAHQHHRGIDISQDTWNDVGMTNPSDENWTYGFDGLLATANLGTGYKITATDSGSLGAGNFYPKEGPDNRWTGALE